MRKIVIINPKGGCGKTTLATNLAAYYAQQGQNTTLLDMDSQASSTRWLSKRPPGSSSIHGIAGHASPLRVTRSWQLRMPGGTAHLIVDTPAALDSSRIAELTRQAHAILVPVLPSDIDIHAATTCITDLLLVARVSRRDNRLGVIANRVRRNTLIYHSLIRFLNSLDIPFVAGFRDSQHYVRAVEQGLGIHEMKGVSARPDLAQWDRLITWIETRTPVI